MKQGPNNFHGSNTGKLVRRRLSFERDFTQLPNEWLRDERLSFRAIGILARLMSHEPGWSITIKDLAKRSADGPAAISTALGELKSAGYLTMKRVRNERGVITGINWEIFDPSKPVDNPELPGMELSTGKDESVEKPWSEPQRDYPALGKPALGKPALGNRGLKEDQPTEDLKERLKNVTTEEPVDNSPNAVYRREIAKRCPGSPNGRHIYEQSGWCRWGEHRRPEEPAE